MTGCRFVFRLVLSGLCIFSLHASATTPIVSVTSPGNGSQNSSPVNFRATASSPDCTSGIAAMRIYPSPGDAAYTVNADQLDVDLNLAENSYSAVVQAWDNCGGVGKTTVDITVNGVKLPPPRFFYSTQYAAGKVGGYVVDPQSGALSSTGQPPVWAHWGPTRIASDSGGYRLYVANQGSHDVSAYFINRDNGFLTPVPGTNFPTAGWSTDIVVHPSDKFVYVTTSDDNKSLPSSANSVTAFSVASDGSLVSVPGSPFETSGEELAVAVDPSGKFLYATGVRTDSDYTSVIDGYSIDQASGALTPLPGSPFAIVPPKCQYCLSFDIVMDLAVDPGGKFLIAPGWANGVIYVYQIDASTGALSGVAGSPFIDGLPTAFTPSYGPISVTVSANDKFVFLENQLISEVMVYQLNPSTGALTLVNHAFGPYHSFSLSWDSIRADPSGSFVYALGYVDTSSPVGGMIGWALDQANGSLTVVPGAPYPDNIDLNVQADGITVTR
jgi:6-phosphogluconolactonase (cycloisomerase 2 family)